MDLEYHAGEAIRIESTATAIDGTEVPITGTGTVKVYDAPHGLLVLAGDYTIEGGKAVSIIAGEDTATWDYRVLYYEIYSNELQQTLESGKLIVK